MNEIEKVRPQELLTLREKTAYDYTLSHKEAFLSPVLADQLYRLFESGKTCEEIKDLNKGLTLGSIVRARIDHGWDERRFAYFESLKDRARGQAQQLALESLNFLGDFLTAFHRHDKEKLQRFIQTGDEEELGGALITTGASLKTYQSVVELLMKLTGQDVSKVKVDVSGTVEHRDVTPMTSEQAAQFLSGIVRKKNG